MPGGEQLYVEKVFVRSGTASESAAVTTVIRAVAVEVACARCGPWRRWPASNARTFGDVGVQPVVKS